MTAAHTALAVLLLPLLSAALIACFLRSRGVLASVLSLAAASAVAAGALALAFGGQRFEVSAEWLRLGDLAIYLGFKFDDLAALMLSIVGVVGLCIHIFSLAYMGEDPSRARFFGGLSIFMFSMIGIVLADNLFMMFVFWELVGFSSWLLINHWHERPTAAEASKKAFITNRVGDVGFVLGIIVCYWANGTVNLTELAKMGGEGALVYSRAIPLLLFCGAVGKSAQLPLQVWLPDAMEGPTPVSALIHAATMVAAGIYMLCRVQMLMVPQALEIILWVGVATSFYAALCAVIQSDIKKVLAYSTLSQLGFMVAAFGLGSIGGGAASGVGAAMFHLTTHAFFKALLFLGAGSVIHACHHEQNIFKMGGLAQKLPVTFATFTIGAAAISGVPFLAGFFSKDAILNLAWHNNHAVFGILAFTAALTAFYMMRLWKLVFLGATRSEEADHAHENGPAILGPLAVLAVLSVLGGYRGLYPSGFEGVLGLVPEASGGDAKLMMLVSLIILGVGVGAAAVLYGSTRFDALSERSPGLFKGLVTLNQVFDRAYGWYIAKVQQRFAMLLNFLDVVGLAGLVVRGVGSVVGMAGLGVRAVHVGRISAYVFWFLAGVVVLWAFATGHF